MLNSKANEYFSHGQHAQQSDGSRARSANTGQHETWSWCPHHAFHSTVAHASWFIYSICHYFMCHLCYVPWQPTKDTHILVLERPNKCERMAVHIATSYFQEFKANDTLEQVVKKETVTQSTAPRHKGTDESPLPGRTHSTWKRLCRDVSRLQVIWRKKTRKQ